MNSPTTSIITPTLNSSAFIEACIASVRAQTRDDWELILVDDASEDDTVTKLQTAASQDSRIKVIPLQKNQGAARARNQAIHLARGRYIAFLDSDDLWEPEKLERQLTLLESTGHGFAYGAYYIRREKEGEHRDKLITPKPSVTYRGLLNATIIATSTAIYDTQAFGGKVFMPDIRKRQDLGLWLKLLRRTDKAVAVADQPIATICKRAGSLSGNKFSALYHTWRLYRDQEGLSIPASAWHFTNYATRAIFKYLG